MLGGLETSAMQILVKYSVFGMFYLSGEITDLEYSRFNKRIDDLMQAGR